MNITDKDIPECYHEKFELVYHEEYRINMLLLQN